MSQLAAIILAAGQSTRFKSKRSKVMHDLAGRPVVSYPIAAARGARASHVVCVVSAGQDDLRAYLKGSGIKEVIQRKTLGTANAVEAAAGALSSFDGHVLILCGDAPLVRSETLLSLASAVTEKNAKLGVLTMTLNDPFSYGRIVRDLDGQMIRIVEEKDAKEKEKSITEVNSGVILAEGKWLFKILKNIQNNNAKGEFYLTDLVSVAVKEGARVLGFNAGPPEDFLGINTGVDLSKVALFMRERINRGHMFSGVGILDQQNTAIDADVKIGADTTIMPYSFLLGQTKIGKDCIIENGVVIRNMIIGDGVHIKAHSVLDDSTILDEAVIGPFARIRPASKVGKRAKIGNFVELKKCEMKAGAKASHLTYLGDATIGANANIGCGTITCNYDGKLKHRTTIGEGVFVGSDVQFIAPVKIGKGSVIGAGATITKDVPADSLALSRVEQVNIKGWAKRKKTR